MRRRNTSYTCLLIKKEHTIYEIKRGLLKSQISGNISSETTGIEVVEVDFNLGPLSIMCYLSNGVCIIWSLASHLLNCDELLNKERELELRRVTGR